MLDNAEAIPSYSQVGLRQFPPLANKSKLLRSRCIPHRTISTVYIPSRRQFRHCQHPLKRLDFHPFSTTLLATFAIESRRAIACSTQERDKQRTNMLWTRHNKSLGVTVELSLSSLMLAALGPDTRGSSRPPRSFLTELTEITWDVFSRRPASRFVHFP